MQSVPDLSTVIHTDPRSLWPARATDETDGCHTNHRVSSIANTMMRTLKHQFMSARESVAEALSIDIWTSGYMNDGDNNTVDLDWHNMIETVRTCHAEGVEMPLHIPVWHFCNVINQFQNQHYLNLRTSPTSSDWGQAWLNPLKRAVNAQHQFRKILLPCMQAQLAMARKNYENACTAIAVPTDDLNSQSARFQTSLTQVRDLAKSYNWAVRALQSIVSAFPQPKMTVRNIGLYALLRKNLRADLSQMRTRARQAYFFDTFTQRKRRGELTQRLQGDISTPPTSEQQKELIQGFLARVEKQRGTRTRAPRQMLELPSCSNMLKVCSAVMLVFLVSDLERPSRLPDFSAQYGNSHRFITQCPNPGYHPLSSIDEAFYRYESGESIGKQMIVDLFLAGEEMTPSNARIAFQLALDDIGRDKIELINKVSREFLEDFECAGNSLLVNFIRHDLDTSTIEVAISRGASLEATLHGITPIMAAVLQEKPEIIRLLWKHGARVRVQPFEGRTALDVMQRNRDSDMRRLACEIEGCHTSFQGVPTDLHRLVTTASAEEVSAYIASGAEVNVWDANGNSPLDLVLSVHNKADIDKFSKPEIAQIIRVLLNAGATIRYSGFLPHFFLPHVMALPEIMLHFYMENPLVITPSLLGKKEWEIRSQKVLSHAFEIEGPDGFIRVHGQRVDETQGGHSPLFASEMRQSFDAFVEQYGELLGTTEISLVHSILTDGSQNRHTMSAEQIVSRITKSKEVVQIHTGYDGHAIEMFFLPLQTLTYLVINDKRVSSDPEFFRTLKIYQINPKKVTPESIGQILALHKLSWAHYVLWLDGLEEALGAQSTPLGLRIRNAYPGEPDQKTGNCAWESVETGVYSALALGRLTHLYPAALWPSNEDVIEKELQFVAGIFSQWLAYTQLFVAEKYLDLHTDPAMQLAIPMDQRIMDDVFAHLQDAVAVLPDGQERFAKAEARYAALLDDEERLGYHMHSIWTRTFAAGLRERRSNPLHILAATVGAI